MTDPQTTGSLLPLTQPPEAASLPAAAGPAPAPEGPSGAEGAEGAGDATGRETFAAVLAGRLAAVAATSADDGAIAAAGADAGGDPGADLADAGGGTAGVAGDAAAPGAVTGTVAPPRALPAARAAAEADAPAGAPAVVVPATRAGDTGRDAPGPGTVTEDAAGRDAGGTGTARATGHAGASGLPASQPAAAGPERAPSMPAEPVPVIADERKAGGRPVDGEVTVAAARASDAPVHLPQPPLQAMRPAIAPEAAPAAERAPLETGTPDWPDTLGERIVWMAGRGGSQHATLRLNPPHLGSVEVRLTVSPQDGQASVSFHVQHPDAREAIQAALPRLREMMAEAGLQLADAQVSHREPREGGAEGQRHGGDGGAPGGDVPSAEAATPATPAARLARAGLLDLYA